MYLNLFVSTTCSLHFQRLFVNRSSIFPSMSDAYLIYIEKLENILYQLFVNIPILSFFISKATAIYMSSGEICHGGCKAAKKINSYLTVSKSKSVTYFSITPLKNLLNKVYMHILHYQIIVYTLNSSNNLRFSLEMQDFFSNRFSKE